MQCERSVVLAKDPHRTAGHDAQEQQCQLERDEKDAQAPGTRAVLPADASLGSLMTGMTIKAGTRGYAYHLTEPAGSRRS